MYLKNDALSSRISNVVRRILSARKRMIMFGAGCVVFMLIGLQLVFTPRPATTTNATALPTLPAMSAALLIQKLREAGLSILTEQPIGMPDSDAAEVREITVEHASSTEPHSVQLYILSYGSARDRTPDLIMLQNSEQFRAWSQIPLSNLLILVPPDVDRSFRSTLDRYLAQIVIDPHWDFYRASSE